MSGMLTPTPLCAICAKRNAVARDVIDGRHVAVCIVCRDFEVPQPPPPPPTRERVLRALERSEPDGLGIIELAVVLGEDTELGRAKLCAALIRAQRAGLVHYTGGGNDRTYHATDRDKYELRPRRPRSRRAQQARSKRGTQAPRAMEGR